MATAQDTAQYEQLADNQLTLTNELSALKVRLDDMRNLRPLERQEFVEEIFREIDRLEAQFRDNHEKLVELNATKHFDQRSYFARQFDQAFDGIVQAIRQKGQKILDRINASRSASMSSQGPNEDNEDATDNDRQVQVEQPQHADAVLVQVPNPVNPVPPLPQPALPQPQGLATDRSYLNYNTPVNTMVPRDLYNRQRFPMPAARSDPMQHPQWQQPMGYQPQPYQQYPYPQGGFAYPQQHSFNYPVIHQNVQPPLPPRPAPQRSPAEEQVRALEQKNAELLRQMEQIQAQLQNASLHSPLNGNTQPGISATEQSMMQVLAMQTQSIHAMQQMSQKTPFPILPTDILLYGKYKEEVNGWVRLYGQYHPDANLFQMLKESVKGNTTAKAIMMQFTIGASNNYEKAFQQLDETFLVIRKLFEAVFERLIDLPFAPTRTLRSVKTTLTTELYNLEEIVKGVNPQMTQLELDARMYGAVKAALAFRSLDNQRKIVIAGKMKLDNDSIPVYDNIIKEITRILAVNENVTLKSDLEIHTKKQNPPQKQSVPPKQNAKLAAMHETTEYEPSNSKTKKGGCLLCGTNGHFAHKCPTLLQLPAEERVSYVIQQKVCLRCLSRPYDVNVPCECREKSRKCGVKDCTGTHHTLLHIDRKPSQRSSHKETNAKVATAHAVEKGDRVALIPTALVNIIGGDGELYLGRAFFDSGASHTVITEGFANTLKLDFRKVRVHLTSYTGHETVTITKALSMIMTPRFESRFAMTMDALVTKELGGDYPSRQVEVDLPESFDRSLLADPHYDKPAPIDIIINTRYMRQLLFHEVGFKQIPDCPLLVYTPLGYIAWGDGRAVKTETARIAMIQAHFEDEEDEPDEPPTDDTPTDDTPADDPPPTTPAEMCDEHELGPQQVLDDTNNENVGGTVKRQTARVKAFTSLREAGSSMNDGSDTINMRRVPAFSDTEKAIVMLSTSIEDGIAQLGTRSVCPQDVVEVEIVERSLTTEDDWAITGMQRYTTDSDGELVAIDGKTKPTTETTSKIQKMEQLLRPAKGLTRTVKPTTKTTMRAAADFLIFCVKNLTKIGLALLCILLMTKGIACDVTPINGTGLIFLKDQDVLVRTGTYHVLIDTDLVPSTQIKTIQRYIQQYTQYCEKAQIQWTDIWCKAQGKDLGHLGNDTIARLRDYVKPRLTKRSDWFGKRLWDWFAGNDPDEDLHDARSMGVVSHAVAAFKTIERQLQSKEANIEVSMRTLNERMEKEASFLSGRADKNAINIAIIGLYNLIIQHVQQIRSTYDNLKTIIMETSEFEAMIDSVQKNAIGSKVPDVSFQQMEKMLSPQLRWNEDGAVIVQLDIPMVLPERFTQIMAIPVPDPTTGKIINESVQLLLINQKLEEFLPPVELTSINETLSITKATISRFNKLTENHDCVARAALTGKQMCTLRQLAPSYDMWIETPIHNAFVFYSNRRKVQICADSRIEITEKAGFINLPEGCMVETKGKHIRASSDRTRRRGHAFHVPIEELQIATERLPPATVTSTHAAYSPIVAPIDDSELDVIQIEAQNALQPEIWRIIIITAAVVIILVAVVLVWAACHYIRSRPLRRSTQQAAPEVYEALDLHQKAARLNMNTTKA